MTLWVRVLKVLILALFRPRLAWDGESVQTFMVWPNDLDINVHMNNARYMAVMDLGRLDLIVRTGLGRLVAVDRMQPMIASALVRYRRSLRPFERFTLRTRILGWDAKWMFIEHRMERNGELACLSVVKGLFRQGDRTIPPQDLAAQVGFAQPSPPLPQWIADWLAVEAAQTQPALAPVDGTMCAP